jgi:GTP-binding protein HflX
MVFNKIDAYKHLTIDEDDLMTENHQTLYAKEWKSTWMSHVERKMHCLFRQQIKRILKNLENACIEAVRHIHITVSPNKFFISRL